MKKQVIIANVEVLKSGSNGSGKPWTLYKVFVDDEEVKNFTTFDSKYEDLKGQSVTTYLKKEINGKWENWKEDNPKPAKATGMESQYIIDWLEPKLKAMKEEIISQCAPR